MRHLARCIAVMTSAALACVVATASLVDRVDAASIPTLGNLPLPVDGPRLIVQSSARVELLEVARALSRQGAISLNTPLRAAAFRNVGAVASHEALDTLRTLEAAGLTEAQWLPLLLAHGEAPRLVPKRPVDRWLMPWGETLTDRERQKLLQRAAQDLGDFYADADLAAFFDTQGEDYERIQASLASALPGDHPMSDLDQRLGAGGVGVALIPSPLATAPSHLTLPATEDGWRTHVMVLPLPDGHLPSQEVDLAALRYEAVASARLRETLDAFSGELHQASRALNAARSDLHTQSISLQLSGGDFIGVPLLERAIVRSLFHRYISNNADWLTIARREARRASLPNVDAMEKTLEQLDGAPLLHPVFSTQLTYLLEAAVEDAAPGELPSSPSGTFELWEGGSPVGWSISSPTAPAGDLHPTTVERVSLTAASRGKPGNDALRLTATNDTNQWRDALSDPVPVQPGDHLKVTGRLRALGITPNPGQLVGAHLFILLRDPNGAQVTRVAGRAITGDSDWIQSEVELDIPAGSATLQMGVTLGMTGSADFDDLSLVIDRPTTQRFLHHGDFEVPSGDGAHGWERFLVLQNAVDGPSNASTVSVDNTVFASGRASLSLKGDAQTFRWYGVRSPLITTRPGRRVMLTGKGRSEGVERQGVQSRNAHLTLEFLDERGAVVERFNSKVFDGTHSWTEVTIEATAPLDTVWMRVSCLLTMSGEVWFDDLHLSQR